MLHNIFYKAPEIRIENKNISYSTEMKLLGLNFRRNNFYVKHVETIVQRANAELKKLQRFRLLKTKLKNRLYKALILPHLTYPAVPLNICSDTQFKKIQTIQNKAIRWITNEKWPIICPINRRQEQLKLEPIKDRIKRLAEGIWNRIYEENAEFHQQNLQIQMNNPHTWYPSSYLRTFD